MNRLSTSIARLGQSLALRVRLLLCQAEASLGSNPGNTAVITVGAFAVLFVLALVSSENHPPEQLTCSTDLAHTKGVRQQEEVQEEEGPPVTATVSQCGPWT